MGKVMRVAIVDDDFWALEGQRARLTAVAGIVVAATVAQRQAAAWTVEWDGIDVALIDAFDPDEDFDRFPGVAVVESLRRRRSPEQTTAIVISGHMKNQLLKQRMYEAGADYYYHRSDVQTLDHLIDAILRPAHTQGSTQADPDALRRLGAGPGSKPNAAIREVINAGMTDAINPDIGQKQLDTSRRSIINLRARIARHANLIGPTSGATGTTNATATPSWKHTRRFLNRALGRDLGASDDD